MHRGRLAVAAVIVVVAAACSSSGSSVDQAGTCDIHPGTNCSNQKLQGVSMVAANLRGANFSGADLSNADLRNADLRDANFVKAQLGAVDFTGANLTGANLTGANLFYTNFSGAKMVGTVRTGAYSCNVTQPDGGLVEGACPAGTGSGAPTPAKPTGPPTITYFRIRRPASCLNDASGSGIEVEWSAQNVTGIGFSVDGIRIPGGETQPKGSERLPFVCDGKPHTVSMQVFGAGVQNTTSSFTVSLKNSAPLAPPGA